MKTINKCIETLNKLLVEGNAQDDEKLFISVIDDCKYHFQLKVKILDFNFYNEERLVEAKEKKINAVKNQNFEFAAHCKEAENKCIELIEMKNNQNIVKSEFLYKNDCLVFYYLAENDQQKRVRKTLDFVWNVLL